MNKKKRITELEKMVNDLVYESKLNKHNIESLETKTISDGGYLTQKLIKCSFFGNEYQIEHNNSLKEKIVELNETIYLILEHLNAEIITKDAKLKEKVLIVKKKK